MAKRTITLELDAYEKLRAAKKSGESFSDVVRRAILTDTPLTGTSLRAYYRAGGSGVSERYLSSLFDQQRPEATPPKWRVVIGGGPHTLAAWQMQMPARRWSMD